MSVLMAPQVGLEPTTLRLTGVTLRFFCGRNCSFFYYICATILKTSGRRVCGRFVAENVAIFLPQAPSKRHEYMQGALDLILHIIMQFDPSTICHIKSKGHEESKDNCAKAPRVVSREEPFPLDKENCESIHDFTVFTYPVSNWFRHAHNGTARTWNTLC